MFFRARKLAGLSRREWSDLLAAQWALVRAALRVRYRPIGSLAIRGSAPPDGASGDASRAQAIGRAVQRAATRGLFRPYCLVRALALRELLEANGIRGSNIRIGVRRNEGEFQAHAWVRWGVLVLGDEPAHTALFTEVDDLRVLGRP